MTTDFRWRSRYIDKERGRYFEKRLDYGIYLWYNYVGDKRFYIQKYIKEMIGCRTLDIADLSGNR